MFAAQLAVMALAAPREGEHTDRLLMTAKRIGDLLDRIECLRHPCDLDLLLFFSRHPRAYLLSERLAEYVGYELPQVAQSLETVITAGRDGSSPGTAAGARPRPIPPGSTCSRRAALAAGGSRRSCESPQHGKAGWPSFTHSNSDNRQGPPLMATLAPSQRSRRLEVPYA